MIRIFITCCIFLVVLCPSSSQASSQPFDPGIYLYYHHLVIEATLISDVEVQPKERIEEEPGWSCPTNLACIVVNRLVWQVEGPVVSAGDTICFKHRTSNKLLNPDRPGLVSSMRYPPKLNVKIGQSGLFSFCISCKHGSKRGAWFFLKKMKSRNYWNS